MAVDLAESVQRLREVVAQFDHSSASLPLSLQPLINLVQTQTSVIEALIAAKPIGDSGKPTSKAVQTSSRKVADENNSVSQDWKIVEKTTRTIYGPKPVLDQRLQFLLSTKQSKRENAEGFDRDAFAVGLMRLQEPTTSVNGATIPQIPGSRASPALSETSWLTDQTPRTSRLEPVVQPFIRTTSLKRIRPSRSSSSSSSHSISTCRICQQCETQDWQKQNRASPKIADLNCESHVQEATRTLISAMKDRKKVPVGSLKGTFKLYSSDYRARYCVHDKEDQQRLSIFTESIGWTDVVPNIRPPVGNKIAMEVIVYPECQIIVRPFEPPKTAGWKWYRLSAVGVKDGLEKAVEAMFLGDGFVRLKLRLSDLLGSQMTREDPNRFVEFSGVWQNPRGSLHRLSTQTIGQEEKEVVRSGEEPHELPAEEVKALRKADSGFYSRGPSRAGDLSATPITAVDDDDDDDGDNSGKKLTQIWSPVSPL